MKQKHGFTLIEMLGVFTVLAIIMMIGLPTITRNLRQNEEKRYESFIKDVELACETYISIHRSEFPTLNNVGGTATVTLTTLQDEKLITDIEKKPDGSDVSADAKVVVTVNSDKTLNYTFQG